MRRRRRQRKNWLPISPTYWGEGDVGTTFYQGSLTLPETSENGDTTIAAVPLILDQTQDINTTDYGVSMRDLVQGQEYVCDRVVGEVFMAMEQTKYNEGIAPVASTVLAAICLAVLPVDDADPDNIALDPQDYHPLLASNTMAPWMWRRTWILSNQLMSPGAASFGEGTRVFASYPPNTAYYGGMTGGHLDTKGVKRRIRKEQRLFLIAAAGMLDIGGSGTDEPVGLKFAFDLRALGAMRTARNQSTFK